MLAISYRNHNAPILLVLCFELFPHVPDFEPGHKILQGRTEKETKGIQTEIEPERNSVSDRQRENEEKNRESKTEKFD